MITSENVTNALHRLMTRMVDDEYPETARPDEYYEEDDRYYVEDIYGERVYIAAENAAIMEDQMIAYRQNEKNRVEARAVVKGHILSYLLTGHDGHPGPAGPMGMPGRNGKDCK